MLQLQPRLAFNVRSKPDYSILLTVLNSVISHAILNSKVKASKATRYIVLARLA